MESDRRYNVQSTGIRDNLVAVSMSPLQNSLDTEYVSLRSLSINGLLTCNLVDVFPARAQERLGAESGFDNILVLAPAQASSADHAATRSEQRRPYAASTLNLTGRIGLAMGAILLIVAILAFAYRCYQADSHQPMPNGAAEYQFPDVDPGDNIQTTAAESIFDDLRPIAQIWPFNSHRIRTFPVTLTTSTPRPTIDSFYWGNNVGILTGIDPNNRRTNNT